MIRLIMPPQAGGELGREDEIRQHGPAVTAGKQQRRRDQQREAAIYAGENAVCPFRQLMAY